MITDSRARILMTIASGINRADWSYVPGGVSSTMALIRQEFPELKDFPVSGSKEGTSRAALARVHVSGISR